MSVHVYVFLLVVCLLCLALLWRRDWFPLRLSSSKGEAKRTTLQRLLKPRCPDDCTACRLASIPSSGAGPAPTPVRPWPEVKSRRGAPKRVNTEGYACPNRKCSYFGITDAHIHALVGDGTHGRAERIQTFRGPACHTTFSARRHTPLYHLKTPSHQVAVVLSTRHHHHLAVPCWRARTNAARVLLLPSPPPAPPVRRAAHTAPLQHTGAVALAGHRPLHEASARAPSGSPYPTDGTPVDPLPATNPRSWLPPTLHQ